jgi:hypothetical protein
MYRVVKIGRANDNDIVRTDASVSRYHCEIHFDEDGNAFLKDCNSTNGTYVNGNKIQGNIRLHTNDVVRAGVDSPLPWNDWRSGVHKRRDLPTTGYGYSAPEIHPNPTPTASNSKKVWMIVGFSALGLGVAIGMFFMIKGVFFNKSDKPKGLDSNMPNDERIQPQFKEKSKSITYDFSCMNDANDLGTTDAFDVLKGVDAEITRKLGDSVTVQEEMQYGEDVYNELRNKYDFISSGDRLNNLQNILKILSANIQNPKGFNYSVFLLKSDELNAFTAGGKIYVTSTMYEFCKTNDELACILGHEIYHNELGHIKDALQKQSIVSAQGAQILSMITAPFGQKNEVHCDMNGIDLAISSGYNGCVSIEIWNRIQQSTNEGKYNVLDNLLRTHPYSEKRSVCSHNHILQNYKFDCTGQN